METDQRTRSIFRTAVSNPVERAKLDLRKYMKECFPDKPPELSQIVKKYPSLKKLATLIHNILYTSSQEPITFDTAQEIECAFCNLLWQNTISIENSVAAEASLKNVQSTQSLIVKMEKEASSTNELKQNLSVLKQENDYLRVLLESKETYDAETQIDFERPPLQEISIQTLPDEERISLQNDYAKLREDSKIQESELFKLKKAYAKINKVFEETNENLNHEISKNQTLNTKIQENERTIDNLKQNLKNLYTDTITLKNTLKNKNQITDNNQKYREIIEKILRHYEFQKSELQKYQTNKAKAERVIELQNKFINSLQQAIVADQNKYKQLSNKFLEFQQQVAQERNNYVKSKQMYDESASKINKYETILQNIRNVVDENAKFEDIPSLITKKTDVCTYDSKIDELNLEIQNKQKDINQLSNLCKQLFNNNPSWNILTSNHAYSNKSNIEIKGKLSAIAKYVKEHNIDVDTQALTNNTEQNKLSDYELLFTDILSSVCQLFNEESSNRDKYILQLFHKLGYKGDSVDDISVFVDELLDKSDQAFTMITKSLNSRINSPLSSPINSLISISQSAAKFIQSVERHLHRFVPTAKVTSIPSSIKGLISDLNYEIQSSNARLIVTKESIEKENQKKINELLTQVDTFREKLKIEKENRLNNENTVYTFDSKPLVFNPVLSQPILRNESSDSGKFDLTKSASSTDLSLGSLM
ncbi:hypothetical protein TVAG_160230 [Trichomonas vaginalis G3]|uniref:E3 ubiquitin protein ligase n=1 Tax=Trichomonas vaginalis (strain ATCC PRA-98 / G3) TaxID=412133 RepID=A2DUW5_TRIV3|nr:hypothetical protein TVAGG3_0259170 [Trichomonas vaginalis G3]EAY15850.1 hypothetical protein TVAG_160230 [Trichomonas vaginalis G3]KAI5524981.1 hypothetical protein TVAGG3_0259170 [Trichomonas vaginalis G3]|eukprot:XP_001328073.1 hypothetical protein [Trichomonas vaginalis G3]